MKLLNIFCLILCIANNSFSQEDTSLGKYSYLIVGLKGDTAYQDGTGFFLKTNEAIALLPPSM